MERLTRRTENGTAVYATPNGDPVKWENNRNKVLRKLADYEDLEEQGKLLKLPLGIDSSVYACEEVYKKRGMEITEYNVTNINIVSKNDITFSALGFLCIDEDEEIEEDIELDFELRDIGKTVFLTRQEAEKHLKESEDKNNDK